MKKSLFLVLISLFVKTLAFSQNKDQFLLTWKIAKNDTLKYKTIMDVVNEPTTQDTTVKKNMFETLSKSISALNSNIKYQTNLFLNKKNSSYIEIEMKMVNDPKETSKTIDKSTAKQEKIKNGNELFPDSSFKSLYKSLAKSNNNIVLRGRITLTGEVISTYYKSAQTNLIAMFYQLPNKPVAVGEKWKLDIQLISMDQNFFADSSSKESYAYIDKVINQDGEQIAIIKYSLNEFISGEFNNPIAEKIGIGKEKGNTLKMSYIATGQFSITRGRWISYEGKMDTQNSFALFGGKSATIYKLTE